MYEQHAHVWVYWHMMVCAHMYNVPVGVQDAFAQVIHVHTMYVDRCMPGAYGYMYAACGVHMSVCASAYVSACMW